MMSGGQQQQPCRLSALKRQDCHQTYGIQNEECVREELTEKRCFAELLCKREAIKFYHEPLRRRKVSIIMYFIPRYMNTYTTL